MSTQDKRPDDEFDVSLLEGLRERIASEDGEDDYLSPKSTRKSIMFGALIGIAAAAGAAWFVLGNEPAGQPIAEAPQHVPVIKAEKAPVKVKPADPGGMAVPNQDKLVYNRVDKTAKQPEVEHLLPPPKEPTALPKSSDGLGDGMAPLPKEEQAASAPTPPPISEPEVVKTAKIAPPPAAPVAPKVALPDPAPKALVAPKPEPKPVEVVKAAPKSVVNTTGDWQVQLAALRDQARAEAAWDRTVKKAPSVLTGIPHDIIRADLGDKGIFYRLYAGRFQSHDDAKSFCEKLKAASVGCFVAKR